MNYNHLFYFYEVMKSNGITEAARRLNISQPALSSQIKAFEKECGGSLLEKVRGEAIPTKRGEIVFRTALRMFEQAEVLERHLEKGVNSQELDVLNLGVSDDIDRTFVLEVIKSYYSSYEVERRPKINVSSLPPQDLVSELRRGRFDIVITDRPNFSEDLSSLVEHLIPVAVVFRTYSKHFSEEDRMEVQCSENVSHPSLKRLIRSGCALPSRPTKLRDETDSYLEASRVSIDPLIESNIISLIKRAVLDDIVSAILPVAYVIREAQEKQLLFTSPKGGLWKHPTQLLARAKSADSPALLKFKAAFTELMKELDSKVAQLMR